MNPNVRNIPSSLIRQINAKKKSTSIDLGLGEPSLPPNLAHLEHALQYVREHGIRYTANAGNPLLREAIARSYAYPHMDKPENVCVTVGSQEAMYVVLKTLLDPANDELLIVEPAFPSYRKIADLENIPVRIAELDENDDFGFDAERIIAGITERTRAIILCSPSNPTARTIAKDQASILIAELERRNDPETLIWLIHDEIYREQLFVSEAAELAMMYPHTIVTNSLSKSNALTGLRLGWILGPGAFIEQAAKCHAWITSCADTFAQAVARHIFDNNLITEHAAWYRKQRQAVLEMLQAGSLRYLPIDGSFYVCVRIPGERGSLETSVALLDECDVVTIPGIAFGSSFDHWLRLSWVADLERFREGIMRIVHFG